MRLQAKGVIGEDKEGRDSVWARPVLVKVAPADPLPGTVFPEATVWGKGLILTGPGLERQLVDTTAPDSWLSAQGVEIGGTFNLEAYFDAPVTNTYQFQFRTDGRLTLTVDGTALGTASDGRWQIVPVSLGVGKHHLRHDGLAGPGRMAQIRFGGPGALALSGEGFSHVGPGVNLDGYRPTSPPDLAAAQ